MSSYRSLTTAQRAQLGVTFSTSIRTSTLSANTNGARNPCKTQGIHEAPLVRRWALRF
jgi:hypothetical protein